MIKKIMSLIPHITLALALFYITVFIVDRYNRAMAFVNNDFTKRTLLVFALLVIVQSVYAIVCRYKRYNEGKKHKGSDDTDDQDKGE